MHVCLDVSPTAQKHAGLGRYAGEMAQALDQHAPDVTLKLFYNRQGNAQLPDYVSHIPHKSVNVGNKPWRMGVLLSQMMHWPMDKTFGAVDIFHATNHLLAHYSKARTVFTLHEIEGYRMREIAEMTGVAVGTVKAQLHRARRLLREVLR